MKKYISILFTMFLVFSVHAQSANVIDDILATKEATFGQVCYLAAVEQGLITEEASYEDAVLAMAENGQIPDGVDEKLAAPVVDIAFIMSHIWEIKGGLFYRITKGSPRYTFKQFKADGVIDSAVESKDIISGTDLLNLYSKGLVTYGGFNINEVSMEND